MRVNTYPIETYQRNLSATQNIPEAQVIIPNQGPLQGLFLTLTASIVGGTATQTSETIDNLLSAFQGMGDDGETLLDIHGKANGAPDLTVLNDLLQPQGVRTLAPAITTNGAGAGSASWGFFLPLTVEAKRMPAKLNLTWAPLTVLQNAGLASAGAVSVILKVVGAFSVITDQPSLVVKAIQVPHHAGDNNIQQHLPNGEEIEALAIFLPGGDAAFGYVTLSSGGQFVMDQQNIDQFTQADTMLMRSGHLSGELICRIPVFGVDSRTTLRVNLAIDSDIILYTVSTAPNKRAT